MMEFLTPKQRHRRTRQLFIGYALLSVLTLLLSFILVSTARGFELFAKNGELRQNGLLFVGSNPDSAEVYVNGVREQGSTTARLSLPDGSYRIDIQKKGFITWTKQVELRGGEVSFVTYPRLLPNQPKTNILNTYRSFVPKMHSSRDKRFVLHLADSSYTNWLLYDLEKINEVPKPMTVPESVFGEIPPTITGVEFVGFASDNTHFMLKYSLEDDKKSYLVCVRTDFSCQNLSVPYGITTDVVIGFWDGKWDQHYYIDSAGVLRRGDIKTGVLDPQPVNPDKVKSVYWLTNGRYAYATATTLGESAVKLIDGTTVTLVGLFPSAPEDIVLAAAGFNRNEYFVVAGSTLPKAYVYKNVTKADKRAQKITPSIVLPLQSSEVDFSPSNRFLLATNSGQLITYDLVKKEQFKATTSAANEPVPRGVGWLDASRMYSWEPSGALFVQDYDGNNRQLLTNGSVTAPFVSEDGTSALLVTAPRGVVNISGVSLLTPSE